MYVHTYDTRMYARITGTVRFIVRHLRTGNEKRFDEDCTIYHTAGTARFSRCSFFARGTRECQYFHVGWHTIVRTKNDEFCSLTRVEGHLADHDPSVGKVEPQLHVFADSMMQLDRDVSGRLEDLVLHVGVRDRFARVIFTTDTEQYVDLGKYLKNKI